MSENPEFLTFLYSKNLYRFMRILMNPFPQCKMYSSDVAIVTTGIDSFDLLVGSGFLDLMTWLDS